MNILTCITPGTFKYSEGEKPELSTEQSILKIRRIGICGTDLHAFEGTQPYFEYPRILGHEISGEIVAIEDAGFQFGEPITFIPYLNCGHCVACRSGKQNACVNLKVCGVHEDGGMTEYL